MGFVQVVNYCLVRILLKLCVKETLWNVSVMSLYLCLEQPKASWDITQFYILKRILHF